MSSFDDRVQRAISAAMRDHLQYHLDDCQQGAGAINPDDIKVHCECHPVIPDSQECTQVLMELQQLHEEIRPIKEAIRALGFPEDDDRGSELDVPDSDTGEPSKKGTPDWMNNWPFKPMTTDYFLKLLGVVLGEMAEGGLSPFIDIFVNEIIDRMTPSQTESHQNESVIMQRLNALQECCLAVGQRMDRMEECCAEVNGKLDKIISILLPSTPVEDDETDEEVDISPQSHVNHIHMHLTPCTDMMDALSNLQPDELLSLLAQSQMFDYDFTTAVNDVSGHADTFTTTMTSAEVHDEYVTIEDGEVIYDELVAREVDKFVTEHSDVNIKDVTVTTWIDVTPKNPNCGSRQCFQFTEKDFAPKVTHDTTETHEGGKQFITLRTTEVTTEDVLDDTGGEQVTTTSTTETQITVQKGPTVTTDWRPRSEKENNTIITPVTINLSEYYEKERARKEAESTSSELTFPSELLDSSTPQEFRVTAQESSPDVGRVTVSAAENPTEGFDIWKKGDQFRTETLTGLQVGDTIDHKTLEALGYTNVNGRDAVVTKIDVNTKTSHGKRWTKEELAKDTGTKTQTYQTGMDFEFTQVTGPQSGPAQPSDPPPSIPMQTWDPGSGSLPAPGQIMTIPMPGLES